MVAVLGGLGAALAWAVGTVYSTRSARAVGAPSTVAGVMAAGALLLSPWLVFGDPPHAGAADVAWLALGGTGNVLGLLLTYRALRGGDIGVVGPIVSVEGGIAALIAVLAGQTLGALQATALVVVVAGVALTAGAGRGRLRGSLESRRAARWASAAALCFGAGLYGTARASAGLPLAWAILPPRAVGLAVVALPLVLGGRLRIVPAALGAAAVAGALEVAGFLSFALGTRTDVVVTAVLASLTGAIAAVLGRVVFGERLRRAQLVGVATITVGVAVVTAAGAG